MALTSEQMAALKRAADAEGVSYEELLAAAVASDEGGDKGPGAPASGGKPIFERMLIGAFPFVKVRELREHWLGLTERVPDDEMMCGEFAAKYGGGPASGGAGEAPADTEE